MSGNPSLCQVATCGTLLELLTLSLGSRLTRPRSILQFRTPMFSLRRYLSYLLLRRMRSSISGATSSQTVSAPDRLDPTHCGVQTVNFSSQDRRSNHVHLCLRSTAVLVPGVKIFSTCEVRATSSGLPLRLSHMPWMFGLVLEGPFQMSFSRYALQACITGVCSMLECNVGKGQALSLLQPVTVIQVTRGLLGSTMLRSTGGIQQKRILFGSLVLLPLQRLISSCLVDTLRLLQIQWVMFYNQTSLRMPLTTQNNT